MINDKVILVSGGDGFIGTKLVSRILLEGHKVIVIDNNITSFPNNINDKNYTKIDSDVCDIDINIIDKVSVIIHLASVAAPLLYKENPSLVLNPNTLGTRKLLEIANRDKAKFIFASTSEVYGQQIKDAITEKTPIHLNLLSNRSCYSIAKMFGEELVLNFKKNGGNATNLRLFNVYGNDMDVKHCGYGRVISNFFHSISKNEPIKIFGDGTQIRSFIWIDDVIEAIYQLINYKTNLPHAINIGRKEPISIIELSKRITELYNVKPLIEFYDDDINDPKWRVPCVDLITELTGWTSKISLEKGLLKIKKKVTTENNDE